MANNISLFKSSVVLSAVCGLFLAGVIVPAGCAVREENKFGYSERLDVGGVEGNCISQIGRLEVFKACQDVLARFDFEIAKSDVQAGVIRTHPLSGGQFFEMWRQDNVGRFNSAESNIHSIKRTVLLTVSREGDETCIECRVAMSRLNLPERSEINVRATPYEAFTESGDRMQKLKLEEEQREGMHWVDLGRDRRLESKILGRIRSRLTR